MNEQEAFSFLASVEGLGSAGIRRLVGRHGSAAAAREAGPALTNDKIAASWQQAEKSGLWKRDLDLASRLGAAIVPYTSPRFPQQLLSVDDHPALLYIRGSLEPGDKRSIAIVGTRAASIYGLEMAERTSSELAARGFTIVSGLARGIDTAAHRGAMQTGRTIAVIGSGLADIYPAENRKLADLIAENGAVISEFPMLTPPDRHNFPQRNRIVSGLTLGTFLVEAPIKSGAMLTMERARLQRRKLFALPGRADSEGFRGNHLLIKSGKAVLVEGSADIAAHFDDLFTLPATQRVSHQQIFLDDQEQRLLNSMPSEEIGIDNLSLLINLPVNQVNTLLMGLVLKRAVKEYPGKIFKKFAAGNAPKHQNQD